MKSLAERLDALDRADRIADELDLCWPEDRLFLGMIAQIVPVKAAEEETDG